MNISCKLFGHRRSGNYLHVRERIPDNLGRERASLTDRCPRCERYFHIGRVHLPARANELELSRRLAERITLPSRVWTRAMLRNERADYARELQDNIPRALAESVSGLGDAELFGSVATAYLEDQERLLRDEDQEVAA